MIWRGREMLLSESLKLDMFRDSDLKSYDNVDGNIY